MAASPSTGSAFDLRGTTWESLGRQAGVDPTLAYAVALTESRQMTGRAEARPWPWVIRGPQGAVVSATSAAAVAALSREMARGSKNIDVGMMQVSLLYHRHRVDHPADLLDPETNIRVGMAILRDALASTDDPVMGIGRYHSYDPARARAYGEAVLMTYQRLLRLSGAPS
ncbi:MAG: transglycosylase SLT domain-containing protein [Alphaproteobacteria bacterium]|nr:transglycosylase SLT domain-containing protein [Alphaproteobacteria bacterium]